MVFMPPQHGKSELVSRRFPAFYLGKFPKTKIILASYSDDLVSTFNRDCQRIIDDESYKDVFPGTNLAGNSRGGDRWLRNSSLFEIVDHGGFLKTVGVGGSLTGTPADVGIIDDPVKDSIEATSDTYKRRNWDWYNDVFLTRLHNRSQILLTMTRWDSDDLAGMILKHEPEKWAILKLPAINEHGESENDPRSRGEALWPDQHSKERLLDVQKMSKRTFAALYQQDPSPVQTGGEFYRDFLMEVHVGKAKYNPELALHLSFDFNKKPYMTGTVYQVKIDHELKKKFVWQIGEYCLPHPRNTSLAICREFKADYPSHNTGLYIYGDPGGLKESTADETLVRVHEKDYSDFGKIVVDLEKYNPEMRVARAYPPVKLRGEWLNAVFRSNYGDIYVIVDESCVNSIADFNYVKEDSDGTKLKKGINVVKDPVSGAQYEKYGHTSDSYDYFMTECFSDEYQMHRDGGYIPTISTGKNYSRNRW
jgi:hypothetical protein